MSQPRILCLFPDTNFFLQAKPFAELDWCRWSDFDEVHLMITRPVQKEIDKHKNSGNDRRGRRARKTNALIKDIIEKGAVTVHDAAPKVVILLNLRPRPDDALADRLDYDEADDRLVGIASAWKSDNPDANVMVLSHDGGPLAAAAMVDVPYFDLPSDWLEKPEPSKDAKRAEVAEKALERLRNAGPVFAAEAVDLRGHAVAEIRDTQRAYPALDDRQVEQLLEMLSERLPPASDFSPAKRPPRTSAMWQGALFELSYAAPTEIEIAAYLEREYPGWLESCRSYFKEFHTRRTDVSVPFGIRIRNIGAAPAKDALVTIAAHGDFVLTRPFEKGKDDEPRGELPSPPAPPRGSWRNAFTSAAAGYLGSDWLKSQGISLAPARMLDLADLNRTRQRDAFYYRQVSGERHNAIQLTCEQWRHGGQAEHFGGRLVGLKNGAEGVISCRVDGENVPDPFETKFKVKIDIETVDTWKRACEEVERLCSRRREQ